jgi:hypothetical protein
MQSHKGGRALCLFCLLGEPSRWFFYVSLFVTLNKKSSFFDLSIAHFVVKATQKNVNYHGMCVYEFEKIQI